MLHTIIKKSSYQDSITLMLLTNKIATLDKINKVSIMMATPANKDILEAGGLKTDELGSAGANDIAIIVDTEDESILELVLSEMEEFLKAQASSVSDSGEVEVNTWKKALEVGKDTNIALISLPGTYAAIEATKAINAGKHAFIFSDNVSVEDELTLKQLAHEKGLLVMGPDCGTGIINSVPLAFTNKVTPGNIGIVGASGTGIQEVTTLIDKLGGGVSNAIGTGGRDLSSEINAITMRDAFDALHADVNTKVITIISKPPAQEVKEDLLNYFRASTKPVITIFLGEKPLHHEEGLYYAYTLEEAAYLSVLVAQDKEITPLQVDTNDNISQLDANSKIKGLYSGGTLAGETAMLISDTLKLDSKTKKTDGYMLNYDGHQIIDLGDDKYTQGKPHPMIDGSTRIEFINECLNDNTSILLLDIVLGYGSHHDMASILAPAIKEVVAKGIKVIAYVCGTNLDPQNINEQINILKESGAILKDSNAKAVTYALALIGKQVEYINKDIIAKKVSTYTINEASPKISELLNNKVNVLNIGLKDFTIALSDSHADFVQFDWKPVAGGDVNLQKALVFLDSYQS